MNINIITEKIQLKEFLSRTGDHRFFFYISNLGWMSSSVMKLKAQYASEMIVDTKKGEIIKCRYGYNGNRNQGFNLFIEAVLKIGNKSPVDIVDLMNKKRSI